MAPNPVSSVSGDGSHRTENAAARSSSLGRTNSRFQDMPLDHMKAEDFQSAKPQMPTGREISRRIDVARHLPSFPTKIGRIGKFDIGEHISSDSRRVSNQTLHRLKFADQVHKAMYAVLPNGQGNQISTVLASDYKSFHASQTFRSVANQLGLIDQKLSELCELKDDLLKGTYYSQNIPGYSKNKRQLIRAKKTLKSAKSDLLQEQANLKKATRKLSKVLSSDKAQKQKIGKQIDQYNASISEYEDKIANAKSEIADAKTLMQEQEEQSHLEALEKLNTLQAQWDAKLNTTELSEIEKNQAALAKRVLTMITYGAGNCGDFAEAAFYLITSGLCGEIPPDTPVYQLELNGMDHNIVVLGDLNGEAVIVDAWVLAPFPMLLGESSVASMVLDTEIELGDLPSHTIINKFLPNQQPSAPFPAEIVDQLRSDLNDLYSRKEVRAITYEDSIEAVRQDEKQSLLWNHSSLAESVPEKYVDESGNTFTPGVLGEIVRTLEAVKRLRIGHTINRD